MKNKVELLRATIAIIIAGLNTKNSKSGINEIVKYKSEPVELDNFKGWIFSISIFELGHSERTIQELRFNRPDNIDVYNMEYNVLLSVLSSSMETSILTWNELGKALNTDPQLQEVAREVLRNNDDEKKDNNITDK